MFSFIRDPISSHNKTSNIPSAGHLVLIFLVRSYHLFLMAF
jgi:hypothetical protein